MTFGTSSPPTPSTTCRRTSRGFLPVLDEAKAVVPAMSALTGDASAQRVKYQDHYGKNGFVDNAVEAFLELPDPPA